MIVDEAKRLGVSAEALFAFYRGLYPTVNASQVAFQLAEVKKQELLVSSQDALSEEVAEPKPLAATDLPRWPQIEAWGLTDDSGFGEEE